MAMAKPTVVLLLVWVSSHFMAALEAGKRLIVALGTADFSLVSQIGALVMFFYSIII